ncbi:hypothetical protein A2U01_0101698, partial [Trifolium medium]|nr:hypothetical protein [Trifolium medium]
VHVVNKPPKQMKDERSNINNNNQTHRNPEVRPEQSLAKSAAPPSTAPPTTN